jgi:hypothetical protein
MKHVCHIMLLLVMICLVGSSTVSAQMYRHFCGDCVCELILRPNNAFVSGGCLFSGCRFTVDGAGSASGMPYPLYFDYAANISRSFSPEHENVWSEKDLYEMLPLLFGSVVIEDEQADETLDKLIQMVRTREPELMNCVEQLSKFRKADNIETISWEANDAPVSCGQVQRNFVISATFQEMPIFLYFPFRPPPAAPHEEMLKRLTENYKVSPDEITELLETYKRRFQQ